MSDLKAQFEQAQKDILTLSEAPSNDVKLQLYALFKQATQGDVTGERPGMMDFINRAKFDAWANQKGQTVEQAMQSYIALVNKQLGR
ncbi:acyl-CoA-binding protein [Chitinivorax tropicus]|uniref:Acyl-CoA-binding protein n=1 Tax=Chitinivorax tropicus TaxID=714531 RepID=A0A840MVY9_9PROT|nr:acyl-CoA-binding protein [Chitinivorax tropicus]MBB5019341.1 acyl-CoA-binding protein [Chitinivorax tropicus]